MKISQEELIGILTQFNPWWKRESLPGLAKWRRAAFSELMRWTYTPPAPRAVLLSGPRQVGKTTLTLQVIEELLQKGVPTGSILYATFDHPIIKLAGIDAVIEAWRTREPKDAGAEYLFLDEAQFIRDWPVWVKHQVDFMKDRRIIFTGSAMPLLSENQESGVGRWHTISLATLSFYEYMQLKKANKFGEVEKVKKLLLENTLGFNEEQINLLLSKDQMSLSLLPDLKSLNDLFNWQSQDFQKTAEAANQYIGHFHEYLLHGGFPQTAKMSDVTEAQKLLREDIIEKVLKRDMTALFGVRHILELEQVFIYLCMHPGGLLDLQKLCANLEVSKPTAKNFINLLENAHLIYRLAPYGYGQEVLRAKYKVYLTDPSIAPAVLLSGKTILEQPDKLAAMIEAAVFKHLYSFYYQTSIRFTYWQNSKKQEVDLVAELNDQTIPFEIKYRTQKTDKKSLSGLAHFCKEKNTDRAYVVTKELKDFGLHPGFDSCKVMRIPAVLLCYWMGQMELG